MLPAALTGNYGMGKSSVLLLFRKCGALTIDSDKIVASLLGERDVLERIRVLLGDGVFLGDGSLDKTKTGDVVFSDDSLRRSLEDILHPLVFERIESLLKGMEGDGKVVVVEVPLLFERGYEGRFGKTITVFTDEATALDRLRREGIERNKALSRLRSQLPVSEKLKRSDFVIDNNGTREETASQVETIFKELLREAKKGWK